MCEDELRRHGWYGVKKNVNSIFDTFSNSHYDLKRPAKIDRCAMKVD